jgi:hypothetical protein
LQGIEAIHMIRKGRVRWLAKADAVVKRSSSPNFSVSLRNAGSLDRLCTAAVLPLQLRNETHCSGAGGF